jgi:hypothetical protein
MKQEEIQAKATQLSHNIIATLQASESFPFLKKDLEEKYQEVFKDLMSLIGENIRKSGYKCNCNFQYGDGEIINCHFTVERLSILERIAGNRSKRRI